MLSREKRQILLQRAHKLDPVVRIGHKGLSNAVHQEIAIALEAHELIKIQITAPDRETREHMIEEICIAHDTEKIQTIGHVLVIYAPNPEE